LISIQPEIERKSRSCFKRFCKEEVFGGLLSLGFH